MTDVDLDAGCTLNKKIRNAQLAQYNFILGQYKLLKMFTGCCNETNIFNVLENYSN